MTDIAKSSKIVDIPLFSIKNLKAFYGEKDSIVLDVENINIPRNKITVLLGPSGSGKSTLLEILGLMNKNFISESDTKSVIKYYPEPDWNSEEDLLSAWETDNNRNCQEIRLKDFSFVFQSTNFMNDFTAMENVIVGSLIQGRKYETEKAKHKEFLEKDLEILEDFDRLVSEYSGGQRQRMAFARGLLPDFKVLFGDEPTGNLDNNSADTLWQVLRNWIDDKNHQNNSALIVSHNIELALKYADCIMVLTRLPIQNHSKDKTTKVLSKVARYTISPDNIFSRNIRTNESDNNIEKSIIEVEWPEGNKNTKELIDKLLKPRTSIDKENNIKRKPDKESNWFYKVFYKFCLLQDRLLNKFRNGKVFIYNNNIRNSNTINHVDDVDFKELFYRRESKALLSKKIFSIVPAIAFVPMVMFCLILALGFSIGVNKFANSKLNNPYNSFLDGNFKGQYYDPIQFNELLKDPMTNNLRQASGLKSFTYYMETNIYFTANKTDSIYGVGARGQFFEYNDTILTSIMNKTTNKSNCPRGTSFESNTDDGVIITWNFYNRLFPDDPINESTCANLRKWPFVYIKGCEYSVPIRGIVKGLPGKEVDFLATHYFYKFWRSYTKELFPSEPNILFRFKDQSYHTISNPNVSIIKAAENLYLELPIDSIILDSIQSNPLFRQTLIPNELVPLICTDDWHIQYLAQTNNDPRWVKISLEDFATWGAGYPSWRFFIDFKKINSSEYFIRNQTLTDFEFSVDDKKTASNFALITSLTTILAWALFIFGCLLVVFILSNLLDNHLASIKMNIGTFLAFGIKIKQVYLVIMLNYLVIPLLFALGFGYIIGHTLFGFWHLMNVISGSEIEKNQYFVFNLQFWIAIIILLGSNILYFIYLINKYSQVPPSLLIYDKQIKNN
jgi:ABC-type lipoprotein export system ATPase subunit